MSMMLQSQASLTTLVSFLNAHSSEKFTQKDVQWLFQIPQVANVLNRVAATTLEGNECVLGVDELDM